MVKYTLANITSPKGYWFAKYVLETACQILVGFKNPLTLPNQGVWALEGRNIFQRVWMEFGKFMFSQLGW